MRGRSGRQGDVGASKFFISLQDDLMRIFGSERLAGMLQRLGVKEGEAISHTWITKALERAQQKVEARNFDMRKHLLRYDDVMSDQRKIIYEQRRQIMQAVDIHETIEEMRQEQIQHIVALYMPETSFVDQWDVVGLHEACSRLFALNLPLEEWANEDGISHVEMRQRLENAIHAHMEAKVQKYGESIIAAAEKNLVLRLLDQVWKDHLLMLDHLRQGINLRAYAQSNPLNEYKREAFMLFQDMLESLKEQAISALSHFEMDVPDPETLAAILNPNLDFNRLREETPEWEVERKPEFPQNPNQTMVLKDVTESDAADWKDTNRNAPCPCGSGKKYKHCHGQL